MKFEVKEKVNGAKNAFIILHGYGADNNDLFPLSSHLGEQFDYYFPNGPETLQLSPFMVGRAWYPLNLEGRIPGDSSISNYIYEYELPPINKVTKDLNSYVQGIKEKYEKIVIGGFSQGSMVALLAFLNEPKLYDYVVLFSSHHFASAKLTELISNCQREDKIIFQSHAHDDMVLPYSGAEKLKSELQEKGLLDQFHDFYGGHGISPEILNKLRETLNEKF